MENLLLMCCAHLQSNVKIPFFFSLLQSEESVKERKREGGAERAGWWWWSRNWDHLVSAFFCICTWLLFSAWGRRKAPGVRKWCDDESARRCKSNCCVIVFLKVPANRPLVFVLFFTPWKTAGLCLGRWTGVGRHSLGMKSTLPSTEVHVYLWPLLDVDVGRMREPLVQKKSIFKGRKGERQTKRG